MTDFNLKYKYKLSKLEIRELVWKSQKDVSRINKKIRENQLKIKLEYLCSAEEDPAKNDPELARKLDENRGWMILSEKRDQWVDYRNISVHSLFQVIF